MSVPDPDVFGIEPWEVELMLKEGEQLVPGISRARVLRAWAGVRPLYKDQDVSSDREISRTYKLLDHETRDGVKGLISIVGGKWTTYRLMAQEATDAVAAKLGVTAECRTHIERLEARDLRLADRHQIQASSRGALWAPQASFFWLGRPLAQVEADDTYGDLICECELVTRDRVLQAIAEGGAANVDDIRRDTRLGMGPCQGGFCTYRAVALWNEVRGFSGAASAAAERQEQPPREDVPKDDSALASGALLRQFLQERWKGLTAIAWGDQLRQARLDELIYLDTLGVDLLPTPKTANNDGLVTSHPAIATEYHRE
jgi:glycerol-3-phosphate dehydrogenase